MKKKKKEAKKKRKRMQMPMKEAYTVGRSVLCVHTYQTSFCVYVCSQMKSEVVWREPKNNARVVLHTTLVVFKPRTDASFFPSLTKKKKKRFKKIKRKMCSRACNIRWWRLIVFLYVKKERKMKRYSKKRKKKRKKTSANEWEREVEGKRKKWERETDNRETREERTTAN